jgi:hypothetical protein
MLVPSMNLQEVSVEANAEYETLVNSSTLQRLISEYLIERHKKKIKHTQKYIRFYTLKSKKKNNWLIMVSPKAGVEYISSPDDFTCLCILYYHSEKGLRFVATSPTRIISVYNEHLFTRYRERLHLNISGTIEIAKHYFERNNTGVFQSFPMEEFKRKIIAVESNGFSLGELHISNNKIVMYYKTFISRETASMKHAKSLFELEKIYRNSELDEDSKQFYDALGFDNNSEDNSKFFDQWEKLRDGIITDDFQHQMYHVVSDEEREKSKNAAKSNE